MMWFLLFKENRVLKSDTQKWRNTSRITWVTLFIWYRVCSFVASLKVGILTLLLLQRWQCWIFSITFTPGLSVSLLSLRGGPPTEPGWVLILQLRSSALSLLPLSTHLLPLPPHECPLELHDSLLHSLQWVWVDFLYFFSIFSVLYFKHNPKLISSYCIAPIPPPSLVVIYLIRSSYFIWVDFFRWGFSSTNGKYSPSFC